MARRNIVAQCSESFKAWRQASGEAGTTVRLPLEEFSVVSFDKGVYIEALGHPPTPAMVMSSSVFAS